MAWNPNTGNYESLADTGYTRADLQSFFDGLVGRSGASYQAGDIENLAAKLIGGSGYIRETGGDPGKAFGEFEQQYMRRGNSQTTGSGVDSTLLNVGTGVADVAGIPVSPFTPNRAAPVASYITTSGASLGAAAEPTSGPVGLAYPSDPVNYATGQVSPTLGYSGLTSGLYPTSVGPSYGGGGSYSGGYAASLPPAQSAGLFSTASGDNTMLYVLLAAGAVGIYLLTK